MHKFRVVADSNPAKRRRGALIRQTATRPGIATERKAGDQRRPSTPAPPAGSSKQGEYEMLPVSASHGNSSAGAYLLPTAFRVAAVSTNY